MKTLHLLSSLAAAALLGVAPVGCGKEEPPPPPTGAAAPVHEHVAPHKGTLIELGEEFAHVELVVDRATGTATAYVLDGEAENPAPIALPTLEFTGDAGGTPFAVTLTAVSSKLTGETLGNTSEFRGQSDALKGLERFKGVLKTITVKGGTFGAVDFRFPEGNDEKKDAGGNGKAPAKGKE